MKTRKRTILLVSGLVILALALGITTVFAQTDSQEPQPGTETPVPAVPPVPGERGFHHGFGMPAGASPHDELLAAELGIDVETLQAARQEAMTAAMEQGGFGFRGHHGMGDGSEMESFLAEALGVSVETLQAARERTQAALLDQMIEAGQITQEQADWMKAQQALKAYIDREALTAQVLDMSVEELDAAREAGTPMSELLGDMTYPEFVAAMQAAYQAAVEQAAADDVITEAQAEQILSGAFGSHGMEGFGGQDCPGGQGGFGPRGGFKGHGGMGHGGMGGFGGRGFAPGNGNAAPAVSPAGFSL